MNEQEDTIKSLIQDGDLTKSGDKLLFNPYNPENIEITLNDVQSILSSYGISEKVNNLELYKRAFVHRSYTKHPELENIKANIEISKCPPDCISLKTKSNERLEFIGDGVLELITKYYLYRRFPKEKKMLNEAEEIIIALSLLHEKRTNEYKEFWGESEWERMFVCPNYDYEYFDKLDEAYEIEQHKLNEQYNNEDYDDDYY